MIDSSTLMNLATMGLAGLAIPKNISRSNFIDTEPSAGVIALVIIIFILIFVIYTMLYMATYKLKDSVLQTILCVCFGYVYLTFALIYYGFNGYKFVKKM